MPNYPMWRNRPGRATALVGNNLYWNGSEGRGGNNGARTRIFLDVNGDGYLSAADVLSTVNRLNRSAVEAEGPVATAITSPALASAFSAIHVDSEIEALAITHRHAVRMADRSISAVKAENNHRPDAHHTIQPEENHQTPSTAAASEALASWSFEPETRFEDLESVIASIAEDVFNQIHPSVDGA